MKKIFKKILFGCFIFSCFISVKAETYSVNTLFPIDTEATVETNSFTYQNMSFSSNLDDMGNATIYFQQIINRTDQKIPVSINVLLFNNDKKNIGFVTYCTNNDYDSSYNRFELDANKLFLLLYLLLLGIWQLIVMRKMVLLKKRNILLVRLSI